MTVGEAEVCQAMSEAAVAGHRSTSAAAAMTAEESEAMSRVGGTEHDTRALINVPVLLREVLTQYAMRVACHFTACNNINGCCSVTSVALQWLGGRQCVVAF